MLLVAAGAITLQWNFEGGSLGRAERVTETHWRCHLAGQVDQDGRNRQANWYYFRVDGAKGRELTLDLVSLPGEYNYRSNRGAVTGDTVPVFSDDNVHWTHFSQVEYDEREPRLRVRHRPRGNRFWVAHVQPYTTAHLARLERAVRSSRWAKRESCGRTLEGRPIRLWTFTDPAVANASKKVIWLMFRQHAWETGSSWVGEGAVGFLLSEAAASIRRETIVRVFPVCDPDGVVHGGVRFNRLGFDLNRNWDIVDAERMPEIHAQRKAVLDWVDAGNRLDLFLSVHNTETGEYLAGPPDPRGKYRALGERFFRALREETTFAPTRDLFREASTTTPGKPGRMTVAQGLWAARELPAFLMEQMIARNPKLGRFPTAQDRMEFGAALVRAAWRAVVDTGE